MSYIAEHLRQVQATIGSSCERAGRNPAEVQIVAVTKYVSLETTQAALQAGIRHIGESRTQDAIPKWEALGGNAATWHFIGHLQTNKVRDMIGRFTYVHSLDRFSLAKELNKRGMQQDVVTRCMVQVNISGEETKQGLKPEEVPDFLAAVQEMSNIELCGFMTMAPYVEDAEETRGVFRELRLLRDRMREHYPKLNDLSMGMSNDYHIAVEEGATFIRLGSTLVGDERNGN